MYVHKQVEREKLGNRNVKYADDEKNNYQRPNDYIYKKWKIQLRIKMGGGV